MSSPVFVPIFGTPCIVTIIVRVKGRFREHRVTDAPNFHQIWDLCMFTSVLYCVSLNLKRILHPSPRSTTIRLWIPIFEEEKKITGDFLSNLSSLPTVVTYVTRYTQQTAIFLSLQQWFFMYNYLYKCSLLYILKDKFQSDRIWPWPIRL